MQHAMTNYDQLRDANAPGWVIADALEEEGRTELAELYRVPRLPYQPFYRFLQNVPYRVIREYEQWLISQARRRVEDLRDQMTTDEIREARVAVDRMIASGAFSWGSDACIESLRQWPGYLRFSEIIRGRAS